MVSLHVWSPSSLCELATDADVYLLEVEGNGGSPAVVNRGDVQYIVLDDRSGSPDITGGYAFLPSAGLPPSILQFEDTRPDDDRKGEWRGQL